MTTIGVLALQGAFSEHIRKLDHLGIESREVRLPADLDGLDGLIIPGGESTTIGKLIERFDMRGRILDLARDGIPIWGSCAGMIVLAREVTADSHAREQPLLGLLDVSVRRNAFGSQLESFETELDFPALGTEPLPAVFIRAPVIESWGSDVEVLASLDDGRVVAVKQGNLVATAFHPELTGDDRFHTWFASICANVQTGRQQPSLASVDRSNTSPKSGP